MDLDVVEQRAPLLRQRRQPRLPGGVEVGQVADVVLLPLRPRKRGATKWDSLIEVRCTVYPDALGAQSGLMMTQEALTAWVNEQVGRGLRVTLTFGLMQ